MVKMVQDLTREQLEELKSAFFWDDETQDILEGIYLSPDEIPDHIIFDHYTGVCFVPDDFFCTAEKM